MPHSIKTTSQKQKINRTKLKGGALWFVLLALLLGIGLGVLSLGLALKSATESSSIHNGAWVHNPYVGSDKASGYTRALVSVIGFLGMTREESIYFLARSDDEGASLSGACTYTVTGFFSADQARWWSITAYNAISSKLLANDLKRYSFNGDNIALNENGSFTVFLSAQAPETQQHVNWIPLKEGTPFDLLLRLYNPSETVRDNPNNLVLPRITKEGCL